MLGTAVALVAMCEATNMSLNDVIQQAQNIMAHAQGPFTSHIQAVREYAANEIARRNS